MDPITAFFVNLIVGVVLSLASTLLQQAFAPKQEGRTGTRGSAQVGGKVPQYFLVGTIGEPGKREYRNAWGNSGDVPNAYLTEVYSFGDLPITALSRLFVNGVVEPISATGHVTQGFPTTGDKAGNLWVEFFDGTQTTPNTYLTGKFGSDPDRPWSADMIGRGVPYITATALWKENLWTSFPAFVGEFQGIPLYDPRQDSTAGGTGTQRWDDPATWAFSDNSAVIIYNIERGIYYEGQHVWGGRKSAAELPYAVWAAAMDACDEDVPLAAGGTEKRFRAGRRVNLNERPADVIKELLIGCNGRISHAADGTVYILIGVPAVADGAMTDADVLATEPLGSIPFPNLDGIINGAAATYREPSQAWEDKETAPYLRSDLEAEDDGRQQIEGLDLGTTFSGTQAQRILKAVIEEGRRFRTHVVALPPEFAQFRPLQVLAWTSDRFGYVAKLFLITARTRDPWGKVIFGLQEIDPTDHDWTAATDEKPLSFAPAVINRPAPQPMTGWAVAPYTLVDGGANARRAGIEVSYAPNLVDVRAVRVQVRRDGDADPFFDGEYPYDPAAPSIYIVANAILPNVAYEARGIYVPASDRAADWSAWLAVTTPDVRLGSADINIQFDEIAADIVEDLKWISRNVRSAIDNFDRLGSLLAEQDIANYNDRQTLRRELEVRAGTLEASFNEIIEVAIGPGGAIATSLESLYAAMGGNTAEVNVKWEAVAAPSGYAARYAVQAAVNDGTFRSATLFLDVPANPAEPTRVVIDADQFVVTDTTGTVTKPAFVVEGGEIKFVGARAGRITSADGTSMVIDFDNPEIYMEA